MSLFPGFITSLRQVRQKLWLWLWSKPDVDFRRMCVLSSLHAQLIACTDSECDKIQKLNSEMQLVDNNHVSALRLPTLFGPKIWRTVKPLTLKDAQNEHFLRRLAKITPCWLIYTDYNSFISDLRVMIEYCAKEYELPQHA